MYQKAISYPSFGKNKKAAGEENTKKILNNTLREVDSDS
jgi:hypothetical protein